MKNENTEAWTETENKLLLEYYYILSKRSILDLFPDKSDKEISEQVSKLTRQNRKFERATN